MTGEQLRETLHGLLGAPWQWRFVGSLFASDVTPAFALGHRQVTHRHAHREVLICLSGAGYHRLGQHLYPFAPGTIFLFDALEEHDLGYPATSADLDHLWIVLLKGRYLAGLNTVRDGRLSARREWLLTESEVGVSLDRHWSAAKADPTMVPALRRVRMVSALALLAAAIAEQAPAAARMDRSSFQREVIGVVQQHIRESGGQGATIEHLAHLAGYSPFHFVRLFKRHTGVSVHDYVDACRLERMVELEKSGMTHKEMAAVLGFSCPTTFSRWLRQQREKGQETSEPLRRCRRDADS